MSFSYILTFICSAEMPAQYQEVKNKPRGVANRNAGLTWIRENAKKGGVLYFADDDNTYNIKIFQEVSDKLMFAFLFHFYNSLL